MLLSWIEQFIENRQLAKDYKVMGRVSEGTIIRDLSTGANYLRIRAVTDTGSQSFNYPLNADGSVRTDFGTAQPLNETARRRITSLIS